MFYRFWVFLTVLSFSYVVSFDALARHVRKKRRTVGTSLRVSSYNNKYRTVYKTKMIKSQMSKYWKSRSVDELFLDAQSDYELILKGARFDNPGSDPEAEMQALVDKYLQSNRDTSIPGVKDVDKEARMYLPPKAFYFMKKGKVSIKSAAKKLKADFNVKAYVDLLYGIEDEMGKNNSRHVKKYRALLDKLMMMQVASPYFAIDLSGVGKKLGTSKRLLLARTTRSSSRSTRDRFQQAADSAIDMPDGSIKSEAAIDRVNKVRRDAEATYEKVDMPVVDPKSLDEEDPFFEQMKNKALAEDEAFKKRMETKKEGIEDLAKEAKKKAQQGSMMVALGIALIIAGMIMMMKPGMQQMGMMLMMAGAMLLMMGMQKLGEAKEMGDEAKKQGKKLEEEVNEYKEKRKEEYQRMEQEQKKKIYRQRMEEERRKKEIEMRMRQQEAVQQTR